MVKDRFLYYSISISPKLWWNAAWISTFRFLTHNFIKLIVRWWSEAFLYLVIVLFIYLFFRSVDVSDKLHRSCTFGWIFYYFTKQHFSGNDSYLRGWGNSLTNLFRSSLGSRLALTLYTSHPFISLPEVVIGYERSHFKLDLERESLSLFDSSKSIRSCRI